MNERIKELAEQAANGLLSYHAEGDWYLSENEIEKFVKLIRAEEREACAKLAEDFVETRKGWHTGDLIAEIRARGEVK